MYAEVGTGGGDVAGGANYRPTDTSHQVLQLIEDYLAKGTAAYDAFMKNDLADYNKLVGGKIIP